MPILLIVGLASILFGLALFIVFFGYILAVIKAGLPLFFLIGGGVAAYLGWEELKENRGPTIDFSSPDEASRYKAEAKAYQQEINEIAVVQTEETTMGQADVPKTAAAPGVDSSEKS